MGMTQFKVKLWNDNSKICVEPQCFMTFLGAVWYIVKYYFNSKKEKVNYMTNFSIEIVRLG